MYPAYVPLMSGLCLAYKRLIPSSYYYIGILTQLQRGYKLFQADLSRLYIVFLIKYVNKVQDDTVFKEIALPNITFKRVIVYPWSSKVE